MHSINILCIGASLVEGFTRSGAVFTPFASQMEKTLQQAWPSTKINVRNNGQSGDTVTEGGNFLERLEKECSAVKEPYDWIIILGGTNDLFHNRSVSSIFLALRTLYTTGLSHGSRILALTIPETDPGILFPPVASLNARRDSVNTGIKAYAKETAGCHVFDLKEAVPYAGLSEERRREIWDDEVHFTEEGYNLVGELIAKALVEIVGGLDGKEKANSNEKGEVS